MAAFFCQRCDNLADSDEGCREGANFGLICSDCMDDEKDELPPWAGEGEV